MQIYNNKIDINNRLFYFNFFFLNTNNKINPKYCDKIFFSILCIIDSRQKFNINTSFLK